MKLQSSQWWTCLIRTELKDLNDVREEPTQTSKIVEFDVLDTAEKRAKTIDVMKSLGTLRPGKFVVIAIPSFVLAYIINQLNWTVSVL